MEWENQGGGDCYSNVTLFYNINFTLRYIECVIHVYEIHIYGTHIHGSHTLCVLL
jgi:hypothetical protein